MSARTPDPDPRQIREYLLRRMSDTVRARFEEAFFRDDSLLDRIESEEDLLVSDYVLGKLEESDRRRFEQSLLGMPYYRERVATTSHLKLQIARHRSFLPERGKKRSSRSAQGAPEEDRLFPGRAGTAIAFAVLVILLVAAVVSSFRLRSELENAGTRARELGVPSAVLQTVVLQLDGNSGPTLRRIVREDRVPLVFVVPRQLVPAAAREWRLLLLGADGSVTWESPLQRLAEVPAGGDLSIRVPPGVPAPGRSSVIVKAGGIFEDAVLPLGLVEVVERN